MPEVLLEPAHPAKKATLRALPASLFMATRCSGTCAALPLCCISVASIAQGLDSQNEVGFRFSFFDFRV
jgi:hypothetical protein